MQHHDIRCCCGHLDCALLLQNCSILESVEKDVHTAAELGQALLARHETYMADAEKERNELMGRVSQLEMAKKDLEIENARTIEENRALLDQLEYLNSTVADSETHMRSLEATLLSSQLTVRRLESAANRASDMERHIAALEQEQAQLQSQLASSQSETKSTVQRWKKAERGIEELQAQLERMEKEAREESDRHAEAMDWMHRRREIEKGIGSTAEEVRLRGSAKQSVVSHFVRDLLQDNANLQMGIAELREMLSASNDEIQSLREQLLYHQPVAVSVSGDSIGAGDGISIEADMSTGSPASTLRAELDQQRIDEIEREVRTSPQLHIHHHYHVSPSETRKASRRKRLGLHSALFTPPPHGSKLSSGFSSRASTPAPPIVSKLPSHRWSVFSDQPSEVASSAPSTPMSSNHRHSLFDRGSLADFEVPSSPATSVDPMSPSWRAAHRKRPSDASMKGSFGVPPLGLPVTRSVAATIFEEDNISMAQILMSSHDDGLGRHICDTMSSLDGINVMDDSGPSAGTSPPLLLIPRSRLCHVASHESIVSLSGGLDIHTLQARPCQLSFRHLGAPSTVATSTAVADVTARPIISSGLGGGVSVLRNNLVATTPTSRTTAQVGSAKPFGLSKLVAWRPWGGRRGDDSTADTVSTTEVTPTNLAAGVHGAHDGSAPTVPTVPIASLRRKGLAPLVVATSSLDSGSSTAWSATAGLNTVTFGTPVGETPVVLSASLPPSKDAADKNRGRASGINQPGTIPGFQEYLALHARRLPPPKLSPDVVDREALREGLES